MLLPLFNYILNYFHFYMSKLGSMGVQWLALLPHIWKVYGMSPGTVTFFYSQKTGIWGIGELAGPIFLGVNGGMDDEWIHLFI